jgi:hypothetical protein
VYIIVSDSFPLYILSIHYYRCYYLMLSLLFVYTYTTNLLGEFLDVVVLRKACVINHDAP